MEKSRDERVRELGIGIIRRSCAEWYTTEELFEAAVGIVESIKGAAVLHMVIGDEGFKRLSGALMKLDADEAVREAEEVLRDVDQP